MIYSYHFIHQTWQTNHMFLDFFPSSSYDVNNTFIDCITPMAACKLPDDGVSRSYAIPVQPQQMFCSDFILICTGGQKQTDLKKKHGNIVLESINIIQPIIDCASIFILP